MRAVHADQILALRMGRSGLAARSARGLVEAAACPASDFSRDAALLALAARTQQVSREGYQGAVDAGELVVAHIMRGAIHALAPGDFALYGRALIARDDEELGAQLGQQVQRLAAAHGFALTDALDEVAAATTDALAGGRRLDKNELHEALRERVPGDLMPWCQGCESHHVAPMLWRYATVQAGVRLDSARRYTLGDTGRAPAPGQAVRRFLHFYGPATPAAFAEWAGVARPHAQRLWDEAAGDVAEVRVGRSPTWLMREDLAALGSPPVAKGLRLLPPGDPYLQKTNRPLLAPDLELRKAEVTVEALERLPRGELRAEAGRVAELRGATDAVVVLA